MLLILTRPLVAARSSEKPALVFLSGLSQNQLSKRFTNDHSKRDVAGQGRETCARKLNLVASSNDPEVARISFIMGCTSSKSDGETSQGTPFFNQQEPASINESTPLQKLLQRPSPGMYNVSKGWVSVRTVPALSALPARNMRVTKVFCTDLREKDCIHCAETEFSQLGTRYSFVNKHHTSSAEGLQNNVSSTRVQSASLWASFSKIMGSRAPYLDQQQVDDATAGNAPLPFVGNGNMLEPVKLSQPAPAFFDNFGPVTRWYNGLRAGVIVDAKVLRLSADYDFSKLPGVRNLPNGLNDAIQWEANRQRDICFVHSEVLKAEATKSGRTKLQDNESETLAKSMLLRVLATNFIKDNPDYVVLASQDSQRNFDVRCYMTLRVYKWIYNDLSYDIQRGVEVDPVPLELRLEYLYGGVPAFMLANYNIDRAVVKSMITRRVGTAPHNNQDDTEAQRAVLYEVYSNNIQVWKTVERVNLDCSHTRDDDLEAVLTSNRCWEKMLYTKTESQTTPVRLKNPGVSELVGQWMTAPPPLMLALAITRNGEANNWTISQYDKYETSTVREDS